MAVLNMRKISALALKKDKDKILDDLQIMGAVELNNLEFEDSAFSKQDYSQRESVIDRTILNTKKALEILDRYAPIKKALFEGKKTIYTEQYNKFYSKEAKAVGDIWDINGYDKEIDRLKNEISKNLNQIETLLPWANLDVDMSINETSSSCFFIGSVPFNATNEELNQKILQENEALSDIYTEIISTSNMATYIFVLCLKEKKGMTETALRAIGFSRPSNVIKGVPSKNIKALEDINTKLNNDIKVLEEKIISYANKREDIELMLDSLSIKKAKAKASEELLTSDKTFILSGYVLEKNCNKVKAKLENKYNILIEFEDIPEDEDAPVVLKNNFFSAPVEGVLESFALPKKGEIDPTAIMSFFYYIFFGLMLADAGYGLLMVLGCGFVLLKFKNLEEGMKKFLSMFFFCGISTTFWGIMFGSYFGNLIYAISSRYFGNSITIPYVWLDPVSSPIEMLIYCLGFGIIHLLAGLLLKGYQAIKNKAYDEFFFDCILWIGLVAGLIMMLVQSELFISISQMKINLPAWVGQAAKWVSIGSAVGIVFTSARDKKNIFLRIALGLYDLYGISSWLGDILSYSRLLALGLSSGILAQVINEMCLMLPNNIIGNLAFWLIILLGHSINIGINLLGSYVHTNRLQYVEFFGKFYEGGGKKFEPFAPKTQFFTFKEEIK